jgi:DNA-binding SARP family transcriptional activator
VWHPTTPEGPQTTPVHIDFAELALGSQLGESNLEASQHYFYVALYPSYLYAGVSTPIVLPQVAATLTTSTGTVAALPATPGYDGDDASWFFPVSADMNSATLQIPGFTTVLGNERGDFYTWTFGPTSIDFVATTPLPTAPASTVPPVTTVPKAKAPVAKPVAVAATDGGGTPAGVKLGAGVAGLAVVAAGSAGLVSFRRRRWYKADREGRLLISSSPAAVVGTGIPGAVIAAGRGILVKLLGPLQVEGTKRPVVSTPVLEIIVFLALHPGETFTSVQLRESIWQLGREPITANTFRVYMVELRKAFGTGVVITDRYHYQLTDVLITDWSQFQAFVESDDEMAGREDALALVRGPVLRGSFDSRKNSPFAWAMDIADRIELAVTDVAEDLARDCLALSDPDRAAKAVARGLLCSDANLELRKMDLQVAAAQGGPTAVARRLEVARAAMKIWPHDLVALEETARRLGWDASVRG